MDEDGQVEAVDNARPSKCDGNFRTNLIPGGQVHSPSAGGTGKYSVLSPLEVISRASKYSVPHPITSHSIRAQHISALRESVSQAALNRPLHARYKASYTG